MGRAERHFERRMDRAHSTIYNIYLRKNTEEGLPGCWTERSAGGSQLSESLTLNEQKGEPQLVFFFAAGFIFAGFAMSLLQDAHLQTVDKSL